MIISIIINKIFHVSASGNGILKEVSVNDLLGSQHQLTRSSQLEATVNTLNVLDLSVEKQLADAGTDYCNKVRELVKDTESDESATPHLLLAELCSLLSVPLNPPDVSRILHCASLRKSYLTAVRLQNLKISLT